MGFPGAHRGEIKVTKRAVPYGKDPPYENPSFKMTHKGKGVPITSVATNIRNLKSAFPMHFRK